MITLKPRCSSNVPSAAAASPFPSELTTPPVTKIYFIPFGHDLESSGPSLQGSTFPPHRRLPTCPRRWSRSWKRRRGVSSHFEVHATVLNVRPVRGGSPEV